MAFKKRCPKCGNWGHKREDYKTQIRESSNNDNPRNSENAGGGKSNRKCWICGKYGHRKAECKNNKKDDSGNVAGGSEVDVVLLNHEYDFANIPSDIWIGDTGASCHLTNSLDGMINLENCSSKITVGSGENLDCTKIGTKAGKIVQKDGKVRTLKLKNVKYVP